LRRVARGRRKRVALDGAHTEPGALVEAKIVDVGGGGCDDERRAVLLFRDADGCSDQRAPDSAEAMCGLDGHVLDLALLCVGVVDELQVPDDPLAGDRDEYLPASR